MYTWPTVALAISMNSVAEPEYEQSTVGVPGPIGQPAATLE